MMDLKAGDFANIMHFSNSSNYIVRVEKTEDAIIYLALTKIRKDTGINIGDPAVLVYNSDLGIVVKGCIISELRRETEMLLVRSDDNGRGDSKRAFERYPVSYDSDLKLANESKRYSTLIKDISKYGFKIFANIEMPLFQKIEISPYLNKRIVFISGTIVRYVKKPLYFEYGVTVEVTDSRSVQELSSIMKMAQEEYINAYSTTDESKKLQISKLKLVFDTSENKVVFEAPKNLDEATMKLEGILKRMKY